MFNFALKQSNVSISLQERVMTKSLCIVVFQFSIADFAAVNMIAIERLQYHSYFAAECRLKFFLYL